MALVSVSVLPEVDKLFGRPPTYTRDQLTGIARINADPSILVVRADAPWKTLKDLVDDAKKRPGEIMFTSSGLYGASHMPDGDVPAHGGRPQDAPPADDGRRPHDERHPGRPRAGR